jgi:hypothetical protein
MPEQYTITGVVLPADNAGRAGLRVKVFDRDLPSLERRSGSAPEMLGQSITGAEGHVTNLLHTRTVPEQRGDFAFFADHEPA